MRKVSVFVGGVQKAGTRSLRDCLNQSPFISMHRKIEPHFFDNPENFVDNKPIEQKLEDYHKGFLCKENVELLCDVTPDYIFRKNAVERVFFYNPKAKWILLLRNPIDRAYSAWNMEVKRKTETLSFEEALLSELKRGVLGREHDRFQYIARSQYFPQLTNLWRLVPKSQCLVLSAESLWEYPEIALDRISSFLNIPQLTLMSYPHVHKGVYEKSITEKARGILREKLSFELSTLPKLLKWSHNPWK